MLDLASLRPAPSLFLERVNDIDKCWAARESSGGEETKTRKSTGEREMDL